MKKKDSSKGLVSSNGIKLSHLVSLSRKSTSIMNGLIQSMKGLGKTLELVNDSVTIEHISKKGLNISNKLKNSINSNQEILNIFNSENDEEFMNIKSIPRSAKRLRSPKKKIIDREDSFYFSNETAKDLKKLNRINHHIQKFEKLQQLKGEILMMEQKKKYTINKTFESQKVFLNNHFLRKERQNCVLTSQIKSRYLGNSTKNSFRKNSSCETTIREPNGKLFTGMPSTSYSANKKANPLASATSKSTKANTLETNFRNTPVTSPQNTIYSTPYSTRPKKKRFILTKKVIQKIEDIHVDSYRKNNQFIKKVKNNEKFFKIKRSSSTQNIEESKSEVDIKKIMKDFKFKERTDSESEDGLDNFDEVKLIKENAEKVKKRLDKRGIKTLNQVINQMITEQLRLNKQYYMDSVYERKLASIKMKNQFQEVCDQTMAIEKELEAWMPNKSKNEEKQMIDSIIQSIIGKKFDGQTSINDLLVKARVMKNIHPLVFEKQKKISKTNKLCKFHQYITPFETTKKHEPKGKGGSHMKEKKK